MQHTPSLDSTPPLTTSAEPDVQTLIAGWSLAELVTQTESLCAQGLSEQACVAYQLWLHANRHPHLAHAALFNLGALQQSLGHTEAALHTYLSCMERAPGFGQAYINMGLLQERLGQIDAALQTWSRYLGQRLLKTQPDTELQCTALNHIGRVQESRKRYDLAEKALEDSLRLNPDQPGVIQHWVHIRQKACRWPVYAPHAALPMGQLVRSTSPLAMLALTDDPQLQLLTAQSFVHRTYNTEQARLHDPTRRPGARWRVGLVSADLREHAVGFLLPAFLQGTDRSAYALYAYDYTRDENTSLRQHLLSQFDEVRAIGDLNDRQAAELIASDEIDILIDLHGLSSGARPGIFALHPAPHQATYLGYIGSTGMPWFQHVLVDPWVMPAELAPHFTERPLYLSRSFIPLTHEAPTDAAVSRASARLPEHAFVMAAFGNVYKITSEMFAGWLRLLQRIPDAVLWLLDDNPITTQALRAHALAQGADLDRIVFAPRCDPRQFRAQLRLADVYLDTYPYNCGSTSNDVVNAGVPLVSRYGRTLVSRMGLSILSDLGRADLATDSQQAYEDKVVEVALRTRQGHRYHYAHRPAHGLLQEALDAIRHGHQQPAPRPSSATPARLQLLRLSPHPAPQRAPATDMAAWTLAEWAGFDAVHEHLVHHTLDAQGLHWLDTRSAPDAATEWLLQQALSQAEAPPDALIASPGWDVLSLLPNPLWIWGREQANWLKWTSGFLQRQGVGVNPTSWTLPLERSVAGLSLACSPAVWFDWLALALRLRTEHEQSLQTGHDLWQLGPHTVSSAQLLYPWLMNVVLQHRHSRVLSPAPFGRPALRGQGRALLPLAVQAAALKTAHHSTGQAHYLQAFEQLSQHQGLQSDLGGLSTLTPAAAHQTAA